MGGRFRVQSIIVGTLIGFACAAILLRQVNLRESWQTLSRLGGPFLIVPVAVFFVNLPIRAWRWQLIFPVASRPKLTSCLIALGIGNMANFLLPGRAGDLARCTLATHNASLLESSRTLATLAVEKISDGLAIVGMVLIAIYALHPPAWVLGALRTAAIIFGGALLLLILFRYRTRAVIDWVRRLFGRIGLSSFEEKFDTLMTSFADGLSTISSFHQLLLLMILSTVVWITEASLTWGLAAALGLTVNFRSAVMASAILGLGLIIPSAPGGLGTYELFGTEAFKIAGLTASSALTVTIVIHAWVFVTNVMAGLALLALKGLSLAQLRRELGKSTAFQSSRVEHRVRPSE